MRRTMAESLSSLMTMVRIFYNKRRTGDKMYSGSKQGKE